MNRSLIIFTFCLLATLAFTQDCNNPMAKNIEMNYLLPEPSSSVSGLKYCKNLQTEGQTCCLSESLEQVEKVISYVTNTLNESSSYRDTLIATQMNTSVMNLVYLYHSGFSLLEKVEPQLNLTSEQKKQVEEIKSMAAKKYNGFKTNITEAIKNFKSYQQSRAKCFKTMVDIQASAYCLACDPNWSSNGVNQDGTINYSPDICTRIQSDCYDYVKNQQLQNRFLFLKYRANMITEMTNQFKLIESVINNQNHFSIDNIPGAPPISQENIKEFFEEYEEEKSDFEDNVNLDVYISDFSRRNYDASREDKFGLMPDDCASSSNCNWLCTNFIKNGALELDQLVGGGNVSQGYYRLLADTVNDDYLFLAETNQWNPPVGQSNFNISIPVDPASQDEFMASAGFPSDGAGFVQVSFMAMGMIFTLCIVIFA